MYLPPALLITMAYFSLATANTQDIRRSKNNTVVNVEVEVVLILTLPCSLATTVTTNNATYTAAAGETLTIIDCPCTVSKTTGILGMESLSSISGKGTKTMAMATKLTDTPAGVVVSNVGEKIGAGDLGWLALVFAGIMAV